MTVLWHVHISYRYRTFFRKLLVIFYICIKRPSCVYDVAQDVRLSFCSSASISWAISSKKLVSICSGRWQQHVSFYLHIYLQVKKRKGKENIRQNDLQGQLSLNSNNHGKIYSCEYPMKNYLTGDKYPVQNHPTSSERDAIITTVFHDNFFLNFAGQFATHCDKFS